MNNLVSEIFREYDIRGIYNVNLFDSTAYLIGRTIPQILHSSSICIARDGRLSSPILTLHLIKGLLDSGATVYDLGLVPTPVMYFATKKLNANSGIMVTASHNPKDHNGFKFLVNNKSFFGNDIKNLYFLIKSSKIESQIVPRGTLINLPINKIYIQYLLNNFHIKDKLKVAWDPGNGATAMLLIDLLSYLPGKHMLINHQVDGNFPNRPPDPTIETNLKSLKSLVLEEKCDLGIGFDGDGDRIAIIDNKGQLIQGDILTLIFAKYTLTHIKSPKVIADVKSSNILFNELQKQNIFNLMWKTGHSLIKNKMAEIEADLAGEISGHIFFKDNNYFDDAIYAALKICQLLSSISLTLSDIVDSFPTSYSTNEIQIKCSNKLKFDVIDKIKNLFQKMNISFIDIDGVRYETEEGWWLIRASNTQEAIIIRCEGNNPKMLNQIKQHLKQTLALIQIHFEELNDI